MLTVVHGDGALVGTSVWEQRGGKDGGLRVGKELVVVRLKNGFHKMLNYYLYSILLMLPFCFLIFFYDPQNSE